MKVFDATVYNIFHADGVYHYRTIKARRLILVVQYWKVVLLALLLCNYLILSSVILVHYAR